MVPILRTTIAVLAIGSLAAGCGGGAGGGAADAHLTVRAVVRRGACLPGHPGLMPYRGRLVLERGDGRRRRVAADARGRGAVSIAPGRYRVAPPLPGSTVHLVLGGRAVTGRYPLHISAGRTARLAVVILPRRGECTSGGAGA